MTTQRSWTHGFLVLAILGGLLSSPTPGLAQRAGFIIGIGVGPGFASLPGSPERSSKVGVATDFKIGYAPSESWAFYWSADQHFHSPDGDDTLLGGFGVGGIGATRFLDAGAPVSYVDGSVGLGNYFVVFDDADTIQERGLGLTVGTGWALSDVWFLDVDLMYSRISFEFGRTETLYGAKVSINLLSN